MPYENLYQNHDSVDSFRTSLDISRDKYPDITVVHKFGRNEAVGTTVVPLCLGGFYATPTALTSLEVLSSSADDTAAGSGAQSLTIQGLSTDWQVVTETVAMAGTTPVALANQYYRIFRAKVEDSGTYATQSAPSHVGTITVRGSGAGATWVVVNDTAIFAKGQSQIGAYTIQKNFTAFVKSIWLHVESNKPASVYMFQRRGANVVTAPFTAMRLVQQWDGVDGGQSYSAATPLGPFPEYTDIGFMAKTSAGNAAISVDFEILLVQNKE